MDGWATVVAFGSTIDPVMLIVLSFPELSGFEFPALLASVTVNDPPTTPSGRALHDPGFGPVDGSY